MKKTEPTESEEFEILEALIKDYDSRFGEGSGHEIMGDLLLPLGISGTIEVFKKSRGRKIILSYPDNVIDGVTIEYKQVNVISQGNK